MSFFKRAFWKKGRAGKGDQDETEVENEDEEGKPTRRKSQKKKGWLSITNDDNDPSASRSSPTDFGGRHRIGKKVHPWCRHKLDAYPISLVPSRGTSPPPFPRSGHSLCPTATALGSFILFGGLARGVLKNDLYGISTTGNGFILLDTSGTPPRPRYKHASQLVAGAVIVWGGDTEESHKSPFDDELYLLRLNNREWHRIETRGARPLGRFGHTSAMVGNKFCIHGGQADGEYLSDLWAFDLDFDDQVISTGEWEPLTSKNNPPPARAGHVMFAHLDMLFIFGGEDKENLYSDVWAFDMHTRLWEEILCFGFIPNPRTGHAASFVDDTMYVFGGLGTDDENRDDLVALDVNTRRWFIFQKLGPNPSARSGHAMAAHESVVVVVGGDTTDAKSNLPDVVHSLQTKLITYPDASKPVGVPPGWDVDDSMLLVQPVEQDIDLSDYHGSDDGPISS